MKRRWQFLISVSFLALFAFTYWFFFKENGRQTKKSTLAKQEPFYVPVSIISFSPVNSPCIAVQIEDKSFLMELDLGLRGDLAIIGDSIDQISSKTFIRSAPMYGIRGKEYLTDFYRIPKIKIGDMDFIQPILQGTGEEMIKDSVFVKNQGSPSPREPGAVGWKLFYHANLLIDIHSSMIAFCDSLETLKKQGYKIDDFVKAPLIIERGLVEFEAETDDGPLRCMLDTGATCNMFNRELESGKSIEEVIWNSDNVTTYSTFKIGNQDFGPLAFHRIPINIPIRIEAVLGMEFFEQHLVFIDFSGKNIYFQ